MHRLLTIVLEVKTQPRQRVSMLLEKLGVGKTQFYKDRRLLAELGFKFSYLTGQQRFIITEDATLPVEHLTLSEKMSLVMALRQLFVSGDHLLTYEGFNAARKIASQLPAKFREFLFDDLVIRDGFRCRRDVLDHLNQAIDGNWRVVLTYRRPAQAHPSQEVMDPYHLFFKRRAIYVEGFSVSEGDIRVYRLSRIIRVDKKFKGFSIREGYDFGKRYRNAFSAFPGDTTERVMVRFSAEVRPYIEESIWHVSERKTRQPDGSLIFEVDVAWPREVMWWAFTWGAGGEILEPEWLREEARRVVEQMCAQYV